MNYLEDLRRLPLSAIHLSILPTADAEYHRGGQYRKDLHDLAKSPEKLAQLTCSLLENVALDPTRGSKAEDFLVQETLPSGEHSGYIWVWVQLHGLTNFVGHFSVLRDAPEAKQLMQAIQANLDGTMFKAATTYRRVRRKNIGRHERIRNRAVKAQSAARQHAVESRGWEWRAMSPEQVELVRNEALEAYCAVHDPLERRLQRRTHALYKASYTEGFKGSYADILTTFALRHVRRIAAAS